QLAHHERTKDISAIDELLVAQDLERGQARRARDRIAAECRAVGALQPLRLQLARGDDRSEGQAAAEGLREREHVGCDPYLLRRKPRASATKSGLDLVEDQERADARRELAQRTEE